MKCPQCSFENPPGFAFCGQCGTRLATPVASTLISEADLVRLRRYLTPARKRCRLLLRGAIKM
jgi:hypothetical protein